MRASPQSSVAQLLRIGCAVGFGASRIRFTRATFGGRSSAYMAHFVEPEWPDATGRDEGTGSVGTVDIGESGIPSSVGWRTGTPMRSALASQAQLMLGAPTPWMSSTVATEHFGDPKSGGDADTPISSIGPAVEACTTSTISDRPPWHREDRPGR